MAYIHNKFCEHSVTVLLVETDVHAHFFLQLTSKKKHHNYVWRNVFVFYFDRRTASAISKHSALSSGATKFLYSPVAIVLKTWVEILHLTYYFMSSLLNNR
jgi:hypothetical protein